MNNEKEIEEMAKFIETEQPISWRFEYSLNIDDIGNDPDVEIMSRYTAENFVNAGYGNVKQAVKEFADKAIEIIAEVFVENLNRRDFIHKLADKLENLIKPYGADE